MQSSDRRVQRIDFRDDVRVPSWSVEAVSAWVTDVQHLPPRNAKDVPAPALKRSAFTRETVEAATSRASKDSWFSAVKCIGRIGRKSCRGCVDVMLAGESVEWSCKTCGDRGVITGFVGTDLDLSEFVPRGKVVHWGIDDQERELLISATTNIRELRAVIARARPDVELDGLLLIEATVDELDDMYTLVEELTDVTRSQRRIELLDGLRASLSTSIDGF